MSLVADSIAPKSGTPLESPTLPQDVTTPPSEAAGLPMEATSPLMATPSPSSDAPWQSPSLAPILSPEPAAEPALSPQASVPPPEATWQPPIGRAAS